MVSRTTLCALHQACESLFELPEISSEIALPSPMLFQSQVSFTARAR